MGQNSCVHLGLGSLSEVDSGSAGGWTVRSLKDPTLGWGSVQSGVPVDLPESGSDSQASQVPLDTMEEPVLESLGPMKARDDRVSLLGTSGAAECLRRAKNRVGTLRWTRAWELKGKGQREEGSSWGRWGVENLAIPRQPTRQASWWQWLECREASGGRFGAQLFKGKCSIAPAQRVPDEQRQSTVLRPLL